MRQPRMLIVIRDGNQGENFEMPEIRNRESRPFFTADANDHPKRECPTVSRLYIKPRLYCDYCVVIKLVLYF